MNIKLDNRKQYRDSEFFHFWKKTTFAVNLLQSAHKITFALYIFFTLKSNSEIPIIDGEV